jgi:CBS domain containing-hemolysin-like protein
LIELALLLLSFLLIAACGAFVAAEFALVTVDRVAVDRAAAQGDRKARGVATALSSLSTQLSGAQVGITITNLAIGFLAEPSISALVDGPLEAVGVPSGVVPGIALVIGLLLGTVLTMLFGELVPKNLAIARPLATARATQGFQRGFTTAMAWPIRSLNRLANRILGLYGIQAQEELASARSPEELAALVKRSAQQGVLERPTALLLERTLAFGGKIAADILTPRVRVRFVAGNATAADVLALTRTTGLSRFPVVNDRDLDDVIGVVHVKQAAAVPLEQRETTAVADLMSTPVLVPSTLELDPLLALLREQGMQLAIVFDEFGGTDGVVTFEDVVEEIVGEISDEHDRLGRHVRRHRDGSWSISGLLRPDEVRELTGVALPSGPDYDTVAGLVLERLGHLARVGETTTVQLDAPTTVDLDGDGLPDPQTVDLTVERVQGRRVDRIRLSVPARSAGGQDRQ